MATCDDGADLIQCPVCFNKYTEASDHIPRILPCYCTLCQSCIEKLIENEQLECPQDRKSHPAKDGVRSFPQNKYVIAFLKKDIKSKEVDYRECEDHKLEMKLFCKDEKCQKAICPMCIGESHISHQIVNITDEEKKKLNDQIKTLYSLNIELQRAKQQVKDDCDKKMKKLAERKKEILDELDGKLVGLMDNVATLSDIKNDSASSVDKIEFAKVVKDLCAEAKEPVKIKFYELVENEKEIDKAEEEEEEINEDDGENLEENLRKRRELSLYIIDAKELFSVEEDITVRHLEVLSDGDVVVVVAKLKKTLFCKPWEDNKMIKFDRDTGEVLYSTELENWAGGMVEVNLGGRPTLAVSYNTDQTSSLQFLNVPNMYKSTVEDWGKTSLEKMCRFSDSRILGQSGTKQKELKLINCENETPRLEPDMFALSKNSELKDMCVTKDPKVQEVLVCIYGAALYAENLKGKALWWILGAIGNKNTLQCVSLACDQRGHIFVCDYRNKCIEMFSVEGLHLGTLVSKGQHGISEPWRVRWCEKTSSLVVVHCVENKYKISALKIHYN